MRRALTIICLLLCTMGASAQESLDSIFKLLSHRRVELNFSCRLNGSVPLDLKGSIVAQDSCFVMKANGMESRCDGRKVVMLDLERKEAYIESATGIRDYLISNFPALSNLKISGTKVSDEPSGKSGEFDFDISTLDSSWVVTDLRQ